MGFRDMDFRRAGRNAHVNRNPLRKVVETGWYPFSKVYPGHTGMDFDMRAELLECGHYVSIREDFVGETNAARRRCANCGAEAKAKASDSNAGEDIPASERED